MRWQAEVLLECWWENKYNLIWQSLLTSKLKYTYTFANQQISSEHTTLYFMYTRTVFDDDALS